MLELGPSLDSAPLTRAELRVLDHLGRGHTNQEIATRFHAAPSTVCAWTRSLAVRFGVPPIDLVLVGALCTSEQLTSWARLSRRGECMSLELAIPREVSEALTSAELDVAQQLADGQSPRDIARARKTSERTVVNQTLIAVSEARHARGASARSCSTAACARGTRRPGAGHSDGSIDAALPFMVVARGVRLISR